MKIRISQQEIKQAVQGWLATQGVNLAGKTVDVAFTATRGEEGIVAEVSIEDAAAAVQTAAHIPMTGIQLCNGPTVHAVETKTYSDGTSATGTAPLPDLSPAQQDTAAAEGSVTGAAEAGSSLFART